MAVVQFDVDGVLADFRHTFTRLAKTLGHATTCVSDVDRQTWDDYGDMTKEGVSRTWHAVRRDPVFWLYASPLVGATTFKMIEDLQADNDVYFATARVGVNAKRQTQLWLEAQGITNPTVVITALKGDTAKALGADYAIDDKAGNAIYTAYAAPDCVSYVMDRPYNQFDHATAGGKVRRAKLLMDFLVDVEKGA